MANLNKISDYIVAGNINGVVEEVNSALKDGVQPLDILNDALLVAMAIVGDKFAISEMFMPEVLMSSAAMNAGMDIVRPLISEGDFKNVGTVVIGTVKGDLHDIGKNLVVMMLESAGFKVINLGVDTSKEQFVKEAKESGAKIVAMSAMLTTTMAYMNEIISACKDAGIDARYMVGGAPLTPMYAEKINAIYTPDASSAAIKAKELV